MFNADVNIRSLADSSSNWALERSCMKARWNRVATATLPEILGKCQSKHHFEQSRNRDRGANFFLKRGG